MFLEDTKTEPEYFLDVNIDNANANSNTIDHLQVIVILWSYLFIIHLYLTHDSTDVLYWIMK